MHRSGRKTKTKTNWGGGWGRGVEGGKKTRTREAGGRGRHMHDCSITLLCKYGRKRREKKRIAGHNNPSCSYSTCCPPSAHRGACRTVPSAGPLPRKKKKTAKEERISRMPRVKAKNAVGLLQAGFQNTCLPLERATFVQSRGQGSGLFSSPYCRI